MLRSINEILVDRNMRTAHGLALAGMESAILADIRERHLTLYAEYARVHGNDERVTGLDQLEFGDFDTEAPKDF